MSTLFKKQYFPESTIKSLATNKTVFDRGKNLYDDRRVLDYDVDEKNHTIKFNVKGKTSTYKTQVSFLKNGVAKKYHCTCPAFKKYSGACKHVVASMLSLNSIDLKHKKTPKQAEESDLMKHPSFHHSHVLRYLKHAFSKYQVDKMSYIGKEPVHVEFILNSSGNFFKKYFDLYLKVGIDHMYVIKNIPQVAKALVDGERYEFGKNFTFDPEHYFVLPEDKRLLSLIMNIEYMMMVSGHKYDLHHAYSSEFVVPNQFVKEFIELLKETDGGYVRFDRPPRLLSSLDKLESVRYSNDTADLPIEFQVTKQGTRHYFSVSGVDFNQESLFFIDESYLVELDHHFYGMSRDEFHILKSVIDVFKEGQYQPISFRNVEFNDFMTYIYPTLNQYFTVELSEDIQRLLFNEPLTAELYLDYKNKVLSIEPVFKYDQMAIHPLNELDPSQATEKIMIRNRLKENQLMEKLYDALPTVKVENHKWVISNFLEISQVIYQSISLLFEDFDFYLTDAVKKLRYGKENTRPISIQVNEDSNLLQVDFDLEDIQDDELSAIIKALRQSDTRYYKLSSGSIIDLEEEQFSLLKDVADHLDIDTGEFSDSMQVPIYQGLSLLENNNIDKSDNFIKLAKSLLEPKEINYDVPEQIQAELRPYQEIGYNWLKSLDAYQFGGVLADDMGLGKTLQSITFIQSKMNEEAGKYLIVCPSSVLYNWQYEFTKFTESINPIIISGTVSEREAIIDDLKDSESGVWITSYPLLQRDSKQYRDIYFNSVILDESQSVKNDRAKTTRAVSKIHSRNKFALSGTPLENNLDELWTLFSIIQPGMFKDKNSFRQLDNKTIGQKIKPFILRRLKGQVLDDLPEKTETTEYIELSKEQKRLYQTQLALIQKEVQEYIDADEFESNSMRVLAGMTRLRQICCDPQLVTNQFDGESAKLERLIEYLLEAKENGKRVVLFSQFTKMLDIIKARLDAIQMDYHYLDGQTKKEDRLELTQRFNEGDKDLFLISLKAGGTGINLTGGDTVILYDSWWNPAIEDQAADRVHRFGQKKPVQVLRLIARGTIEERINELQDKKRDLVDSVIDSNQTTAITKLSKDEILNLLDV